MQLTVVIVTLILMTLVDEGATWGWSVASRRRRHKFVTLRSVCNPICTTKCTAATCVYGCHKTVCRGIGRKRSEPQIKEEPGTFLVTLPCKFAAWDMDKNGSISMTEFAFAGHAAVKDKNTSVVFSKIDDNGDGKISRNELNKAPLLREKC